VGDPEGDVVALYRMYPTAHSCSFPLYGTGYGWHYAAGSSGDSSGDCATSCDDLADALDETNYGFARSNATTGNVNKGRVEFTFTDPPQNVTIISLTLVVWARTSNAGPAIIDSTPTIQMFNYVSGGARVYQTGTQSVTAARNRNTQSPTGSFQRLTYTWTTKPAGGAWTRAELLAGQFQAGFESDATTGHGSGVDATTGGSAASLDWASVYLELETTPSGIFAESVRAILSHQLRLLSRPLRSFRLDVPAELGAIEPGQTLWSSHDLLPWDPGVLSWEQVPLYLMEVEERLRPRRLSLSLLDLREQFAAFWSPCRITGMDDQNSGLAIIHRGGSWATSRNQVAYGQRPGDGLYQQVAVDKPLLTKDGLLIQGGSDKNEILNSTFSQGSGSTFTSWTKTTTGSATVTEDTADFLIDVGGLRRSAVFTTTAAGEAANLKQSVTSVAANTKLRVRIWHKEASGDSLRWQVVRNVSGTDNWWNEGSFSWQGVSIWNALDASSSIARMTSAEIDTGGSISTITVGVGFSAGDTTAASVGRVYAAELQRFTDAGSSVTQWFRRDLLPTTTTAVTREKDHTVIRNFPDSRVMDPSRGYFRATVKLLFAHSDMADSSAFGVAMGTFDLYYVRTNSTTGAWVFSNGAGSAQFATSSGASTLPATAEITVAARWTSAAEDEHGVAGQSLAIWIDGVKGGTVATGLSAPLPAADDEITLGNDPATTLTTPLDGHIYNVVIDGRCPTDDEMARM
jgi:hypothetical protein